MGLLPRRWLRCIALMAAGIAGIALARPVSAGEMGSCFHGGAVPVQGATAEQWAVLRDGRIAPDGAPWPPRDEVVAVGGALSIDLGQPTLLRGVRLQSDADQTLRVDVSEDGKRWGQGAIEADPLASGMLLRTLRFPATMGRYVRLRTPDAKGPFALTELDLLCGDGTPPPLTVTTGPAPSTPPVHAGAVNALKLAIVLAAIATVVWRRALVRLPRASSVLQGLLAVTAIVAYTNAGTFHGGEFAHAHDVFHYFTGAKYFPELGYDGLYDCAAAAEASAGFTERVTLRSQRDLRTGRYIDGAEALARGRDCRARFTPERWRDFEHDVSVFANRRTVRDWHLVLRDHGFNASPAWITLGRFFVFARDPTRFLPWLDVVLLSASGLAIAWAFGARTALFAVVAFACNPLADFSWTGGAFLRQAWFAALILGLCALRRRRPVASGVLLALSALLQLFPLACLAAVALGAAVERLRSGAISRDVGRLLLAATATIVVALPATTHGAGRADAWPAFQRNTAKHAATPSVNLVGLPAALSFRPSTRASLLFDENAVDPFARVREARQQNLGALRPLHWLCVAMAVAAFVRAVARSGASPVDPAMGLLLVPIALETSCYYTVWLVALLLTAGESPVRPLVVLGVITAALVVVLQITDQDTAYALASCVLTAGAAVILVLEHSRDSWRSTQAGPPKPWLWWKERAKGTAAGTDSTASSGSPST